jgi:hypothetical protein
MTIKATWLLTTDLVSELSCKCHSHTMPIYVNLQFWDDLNSESLVDWVTDSNGNSQAMVSTHPVYSDSRAPDYGCTQDIIDYYWSRSVVGVSAVEDCGCRLGNGAHELYCEKWEAY